MTVDSSVYGPTIRVYNELATIMKHSFIVDLFLAWPMFWYCSMSGFPSCYGLEQCPINQDLDFNALNSSTDWMSFLTPDWKQLPRVGVNPRLPCSRQANALSTTKRAIFTSTGTVTVFELSENQTSRIHQEALSKKNLKTKIYIKVNSSLKYSLFCCYRQTINKFAFATVGSQLQE